jgi:hypothetical protein
VSGDLNLWAKARAEVAEKFGPPEPSVSISPAGERGIVTADYALVVDGGRSRASFGNGTVTVPEGSLIEDLEAALLREVRAAFRACAARAFPGIRFREDQS